MNPKMFSRRVAPLFFIAAALSVPVRREIAQPAGGPATAQASAPIDLTGYWVSIVTEDWRYRMVTPAKGDYASVPINADGRKVADTWDPAKDEAAGDQCKSYGAPAVMRVPGRVHITWQSANTAVETDAGTWASCSIAGSPGRGSGDLPPPLDIIGAAAEAIARGSQGVRPSSGGLPAQMACPKREHSVDGILRSHQRT